MNTLERLQKLSDLIAAVGGMVEGRKKLHKLVYLCQAAGTEFSQDFIFHFYGVFSPTLAADLDRAKAWDLLTETESKGTYVIASTARADAEGAEDFTVARKLAGESAKVLEVLSTIVYLQDAGYSGGKLAGKLGELKGHLSSDFARAQELADLLFEIKCA